MPTLEIGAPQITHWFGGSVCWSGAVAGADIGAEGSPWVPRASSGAVHDAAPRAGYRRNGGYNSQLRSLVHVSGMRAHLRNPASLSRSPDSCLAIVPAY